MFETSFNAACWRKEGRYANLVSEDQWAGFDAQLVTVEVGSRGIPNLSGYKLLERMLGMSRKDGIALMRQCMTKAVEGSFAIWTNRNVSV